MHDGERLGWAGQGDEQRPQPLCALRNDVGRFDHDDGIEFEALAGAHREHRHGVTVVANRLLIDSRRVEVGNDVFEKCVGAQDANRAASDPLLKRDNSGGDAGRRGIAGRHTKSGGPESNRPHGRRDGEIRSRNGQNSGRDVHDLGRRPIPDRQLDLAGRTLLWQVGENLVPVLRSPHTRRLADIANDRHRATERPPGNHPKLHR